MRAYYIYNGERDQLLLHSRWVARRVLYHARNRSVWLATMKQKLKIFPVMLISTRITRGARPALESLAVGNYWNKIFRALLVDWSMEFIATTATISTPIWPVLTASGQYEHFLSSPPTPNAVRSALETSSNTNLNFWFSGLKWTQIVEWVLCSTGFSRQNLSR